MLSHSTRVRIARGGILFVKGFVALLGVLLIAVLAWHVVRSLLEYVPQEESVRLARNSLEHYLANENELEKLKYAVCKYYPGTSDDPENAVGCTIDIKGEDEIIYFSAYLNVFGKPTHYSFERSKR
jgi:hypothetical protein